MALKYSCILLPLLFTPQETDFTFEKVIPSNSLIYVSIEGPSQTYTKIKSSKLHQLLTDSKIAKIISQDAVIKEIQNFLTELERATGSSLDSIISDMTRVLFAQVDKTSSLLSIEFKNKDVAHKVSSALEKKFQDKKRIKLNETKLILAFGTDIPEKPVEKNLYEDHKSISKLKERLSVKAGSTFILVPQHSLAFKLDIEEKIFRSHLLIQTSDPKLLKIIEKLETKPFDPRKAPANSFLTILSSLNVSQIDDLANWTKSNKGFPDLTKLVELKIGRLLDNTSLYSIALKKQDFMLIAEFQKKSDLLSTADALATSGLYIDKGDGKYLLKIPTSKPLSVTPWYHDKILVRDRMYAYTSFSAISDYKPPSTLLSENERFKTFTKDAKGTLAIYTDWEVLIPTIHQQLEPWLGLFGSSIKFMGIELAKFPFDSLSKLSGTSLDSLSSTQDGLLVESISESGFSFSHIAFLAAIIQK